jgi:hypothetical protein
MKCERLLDKFLCMYYHIAYIIYPAIAHVYGWYNPSHTRTMLLFIVTCKTRFPQP